MKFIQTLKNLGPAAVITGAFVGPGTITTAMVAGANFSFALLWAIIFSGIAIFVIMDMASRVGIIGNKNIVEASVDLVADSNAWKYFIYGLLFATVVITGLAFEAGNIIGATMGLADVSQLPQWAAGLIMGIILIGFLGFSTPKIVEMIMVAFVVAMGLIFVITVFIVGPDIRAVLAGIVPTVPAGSLVNTVALIGTTLIALNLIFHSIAVKARWSSPDDLKLSRIDTLFNVTLGIVVTMAILITSGAVLFGTGTDVSNPIVYSKSLEMTLGPAARVVGDLGLFFAGISSALATPYAAGVVGNRMFNWDGDAGKKAKILSIIIALFGTVLAMFGAKPTQIILIAQTISGVALPATTILFVIAANNRKLLGKYSNNLIQNILGGVTIIVTLFLGIWVLVNVAQKLI